MGSFRGTSARRRALLFGSLWIPLIAGCGFLRRQDAPPDLSQDARIAQEVRARLGAEPSLAAGAIRVEASAGVVLLHGSVEGIGAWQCAITTSGLVRGVRSVADYLVIGRGPRDVRCLAPRPDSAVVAGQ